MPAYKKDDGYWYFSFHHGNFRIKKQKWNGERFSKKSEALAAEQECKALLMKSKKGTCSYEDLDLIISNKLDKYVSIINSSQITVYRLYDDFVKHTKADLKETTLRKYDTFKKYYLTMLPDISIFKLSAEDITRWKKQVAIKNVSVENKNRTIALMKKCLDYGTYMYGLNPKVCISLLQPLKEYKVVETDTREKYLPPNKFNEMINRLDITKDSNYYFYVIIKILYNTGLRVGELSALTINDFNNKSLNINKDYVRVYGKDIVQAPKNSNSVRIVLLDDATDNLLKEFIKRYKITSGNIFKRKGEFLNQPKLRRVISNIAEELEEDYIISPHTLRHSHASNLRMLGFDEYAIAKRLGNTPSVASSTYIHSTNDEQEAIIKAMEDK